MGKKINSIQNTILAFVLLLSSTSFAPVNWTKYIHNPVLRPGSFDSWDDWTVYVPCVLKHGDTLKMWYGGAKRSGVHQIGYANSIDGINWQKYSQNPVLNVGTEGSWDANLVAHPCVILVDTTYHMWYGGSAGSNVYCAGYATSPDGINWTKYPGNPVLPLGAQGEWDSQTIVGHSYYFDGDSFHVWYAGCDNAAFNNICIGYAKSSDGINWEKFSGNPVYCGSGSWDSLAVFAPRIICDSSGYKMWYAGNNGSINCIGYATSSDGIHWTKYPGNPVLPLGAEGEWDSNWVSGPHVLFYNATYHMWYTGKQPNTGYRIGYATASDTALVVVDYRMFPKGFTLTQNYPNPFNPSTSITFTLCKSEHVTLEVFNTLGQKVAILLDTKMNAGSHDIQFDASELPSGIYFYRIQVGDAPGRTGEYSQVRKMVLLR